MKILMFGWEFPPYISGGLGVACHGLTTALTSIGQLTFEAQAMQSTVAREHDIEVVVDRLEDVYASVAAAPERAGRAAAEPVIA